MSAIPSITDTGFAPWSMMAPTSESKASTGSTADLFSLPGTQKPENTGQQTQVATLGNMVEDAETTASVNPYQPTARQREERYGAIPQTEISAEETMSPLDFLDVINPLHHIPGVAAVYRDLTGDDISTPARVAGGALYGGFIGLATSVIDSIVDVESGKDLGEHMMAFLSGEDSETNTEVAQSGVQTNSVSYASVEDSDNPAFNQAAITQTAQLQSSAVQNENTQRPANPQMEAATGALAAKLASVETSAGGLNMSHMPGAILNTPEDTTAATTATSTASAETNQAMSLNREVAFKPLSKDVQRQLDHINRLNNHNAMLNIQEEAAVEPKAEPKKVMEPASNVANDQAAQMAAYQNAQAMGQAVPANQAIDISKAMMDALQKYDSLLNGS